MQSIAYPLMEHFYTVQGEGANTGQSAYFLRLGGCDVGCVWCDVKESWEADLHPQVSVERMVEYVKAAGAVRAVITGGEPCMYDLLPLTNALHVAGVACYLETSGAHPISGSWDWICLSPKKFKAPLKASYEKADELKVIVYNNHDFIWAEEQSADVRSSCRRFLQPEYSVFSKMITPIIEYVKLHPDWTISLQTHKIMNIP
jgi:7-carboxy-7-deazaguanine synthase